MIGRKTGFPRVAIGCAAIALALTAAVIKWIPALVAGCYCGFSVLSYLLYVIDKNAAKQGEWRISEGHLHLTDGLGGWPGALIAQQQFHHKTSKKPFQVAFSITVIANLLGMWWFVSSGTAAEWDQLLSAWVIASGS